MKESDNLYTYDSHANIIKSLYDDGEMKELTESSYNADDMLVNQTQSVAEGDEDFVNDSRLTYEYDSDQSYWEEYYLLKNMQWKNTDGQFTAVELDDFFSGANRLLSADVYSADELAGTIEASYNDADGSLSYTFNYIEPLGKDCMTIDYTDKNGSYKASSLYYEDQNEDETLTDDELMEGIIDVVKVDEHGFITYEDESMVMGPDETELMGASRYDYTYDPAYNYPTQQIHSEYDFDEEDFVPFLKVVSSDFVDVTTSIRNITHAETAGKAVYSLQDVKMDESLNNVPAGVYIVKDGEKTMKIMKR